MRRIALTGGIACGKSLVAKYLDEFGIETIDADDVVHELIPDPAERRRIAAEVFSDEKKRRALESRLHPVVKARIDRFLSDAARPESSQGGGRIRLAVIPLLFETHWDADYDIICTVISPRETQVDRMMTTRGYTRTEAEARLDAQMSVKEKAARSHYVIANDGSPEELRRSVGRFVRWLRDAAQGGCPAQQVKHS